MSLFTSARRRRRRRILLGLRNAAVLLLVAAGLWLARDLGRQEQAAEEQLQAAREQDLASRLQLAEGLLAERVAELETARRDLAVAERALVEAAPSPEEEAILALLRQRVQEGAPPALLFQALRTAEAGPACDSLRTASHTIVVRTLSSRGGSEVANFADGAVSLTLTARTPQGALPLRWDAGEPVRLVASRAGAEPLTSEVSLPHGFAFRFDGAQYRFFIIASKEQPGRAEVRAEICDDAAAAAAPASGG